MQCCQISYIDVILPIKIGMNVSYTATGDMGCGLITGSLVRVVFGNREYLAVVRTISSTPPEYRGAIKEILAQEDLPPIDVKTLSFWEWMAEYYMCSIGEVYRSAYPAEINRRSVETRRPVISSSATNSTTGSAAEIVLSPAQEAAAKRVDEALALGKPALLKGVTGSGKTEIYIHFALEEMRKGKSVLYMVPEIALSRQLSQRLEKIFGDKLFVYHSKQKASDKALLLNRLREDSAPVIILGLRSALFLPFNNLGLIIVDEEHDSSYKQNDPAPRYQARDSAIVLAHLHSARTILGSATPSLESIYNAFTDKYILVELNERYYGAADPEVIIVDTIREEKLGRMAWPLSHTAREAIRETLSSREQVLVFRNRRSYSPVVQCIYCGEIPLCDHCNIPLSYHKSKGLLSCHYCNWSRRFNTICTACGNPGLKERGCGTEMIEEWLRDEFREATIARFDAETTVSKVMEKGILKDFAQHKIDILVGTQMLSKGFDFEKLSLVVFVQADSMLSVEDFRAKERAMQLMKQLAGRSCRKSSRGKIYIQTAQPGNQVYTSFREGDDAVVQELTERREFRYPPFTRMIRIVIKDRNRKNVADCAAVIAENLPSWGAAKFDGPVFPIPEKIKGEYIAVIWLRLPRKRDIKTLKRNLYNHIYTFTIKNRIVSKVYFDVDPYF